MDHDTSLITMAVNLSWFMGVDIQFSEWFCGLRFGMRWERILPLNLSAELGDDNKRITFESTSTFIEYNSISGRAKNRSTTCLLSPNPKDGMLFDVFPTTETSTAGSSAVSCEITGCLTCWYISNFQASNQAWGKEISQA